MTDGIFLLDVGHGNCGVIHDGDDIMIIDAAKAQVILNHLDGHPRIEALIVSHGDSDHLAGAGAILTSCEVITLYVNPEPKRRTRAWEEFLTAIKIARRESGTFIHSALSSVLPGNIRGKSITLEVVAPTPEMAVRGAGGKGQSANTTSAVIRVVRNGVGKVLLTGDMDRTTLDSILAENVVPNLRADILVFPHHGGLPGAASPSEFAQELCALVQPERIVFSIGRHHHPSNPLPDTIVGARRGAPSAHVSCTQLSRHCRTDPTDPMAGDRCAGDIEVRFDEDSSVIPAIEDHKEFIRMHAKTPLCQSQSSA